MTSQAKLNKALKLIEEILEEGDLANEQNEMIEDALHLLESAKEMEE